MCGLFLLLGPLISYFRAKNSREYGRDQVMPGQGLQNPQSQKPNKPKTFRIGKYFPKKRYSDCISTFEQIT
jgi:hypothetical protein